MFERYTEKARRTIFFARYEASQTGSVYIEPGHLLLGIVREDEPFASTVLKIGAADIEELRRLLTKPGAEKSAVSVDLPLSHPAKRALAYGAEEAERLRHAHIGTEHLVMGLLREDDPIAAHLLKARGADLATLREAATTRPAVHPKPDRPTLANGKICYIEIPAIDIARSAEFYRTVFGWRIRQRGDGSTAFDDTVSEVSGAWVVGRPPASAPGLLVYIMVGSLVATLEAIVANGGEIVQPVGADGRGITARFRDPAGNVFGLYQQIA